MIMVYQLSNVLRTKIYGCCLWFLKMLRFADFLCLVLLQLEYLWGLDCYFKMTLWGMYIFCLIY